MNTDILVNFYNRLNKLLFLWIASIVVNIITLLLVHFQIRPGDETIALHYNVLVGVDWYGGGRNLYFIPFMGFVITVINYTFSRKLGNTPGYLQMLSGITSFLVQLTLLAAILFLMRVN